MLDKPNKEEMMSESGNPGGNRSIGCGLGALTICRNHLALSRVQAAALMRLIQIQINAYEEAVCGVKPRKPSAPFTASDLDRVELLLPLLEKLAG